MTCAELQGRLDRYARADLPAEEAAAIESHLNGCAGCSSLLEQVEPRLAGTAGLSREIEPPADLWPGILYQLSPRGVKRRTRVMVPGWMLAAAAVFLVAVSSGVTALLLRQPTLQQAAALPATFSPLEAQYASAVAELGVALGRARSRLAPATIATIERNLATIDSALAESRRALLQDPGNTALEGLVVAAWRQKMDFLRRATALAPES